MTFTFTFLFLLTGIRIPTNLYLWCVITFLSPLGGELRITLPLSLPFLIPQKLKWQSFVAAWYGT